MKVDVGLISWTGIAAAVSVTLAALGASVLRADALTIEGPAKVIDNATVEIWGQRIRLSGIAVPDPQSDDGVAGKRHLQDLIANVRVRCRLGAPISQSTVHGRCHAATVDLSEHLVRMGYARPTADPLPPSRD